MSTSQRSTQWPKAFNFYWTKSSVILPKISQPRYNLPRQRAHVRDTCSQMQSITSTTSASKWPLFWLVRRARSRCQHWFPLSEQALTCGQIVLHVYQVNEANSHRQNWWDHESNETFANDTYSCISHLPSANFSFFPHPTETELQEFRQLVIGSTQWPILLMSGGRH